MLPASLSVSRQVEAVSSMWTASASGSKVCKPDARSGVHWNFHTGVAEDAKFTTELEKNSTWKWMETPLETGTFIIFAGQFSGEWVLFFGLGKLLGMDILFVSGELREMGIWVNIGISRNLGIRLKQYLQ